MFVRLTTPYSEDGWSRMGLSLIYVLLLKEFIIIKDDVLFVIEGRNMLRSMIEKKKKESHVRNLRNSFLVFLIMEYS